MKNTDDNKNELLLELEQISARLEKNELLFNLADDDMLIEAAIYEKQALNARYAFLLKNAKEKGLKIQYTDRK